MESDYFEVIALVCWMFLFMLMEKVFPWRDHNQEKKFFRTYLGTDLASLVLMFVGSGIMTGIFMGAFASFLLEFRKGDFNYHMQTLTWWKIPLGLLMIDFCTYWTHRSLHRVKLFKITHKWHHTIEKINWLSGFRTSLMHGLIFTIIPQFVVPFIILRLNPVESGIVFTLQFFFQLLAHVNMPWKTTHLLGIFVTPRYHRVHHAIDERAYNSNFAAIFTFYDRIFGTYKDPEQFDMEKMVFGLGDGKTESQRTFKENLRYMIGL
jgi:sterol desaturase/sphingolipid hydroxylase (fatty acid hydroxylase superfamily)